MNLRKITKKFLVNKGKARINYGIRNKYSNELKDIFMNANVYAKRCYSRKYEGSYYIPACKNEWVKRRLRQNTNEM